MLDFNETLKEVAAKYYVEAIGFLLKQSAKSIIAKDAASEEVIKDYLDQYKAQFNALSEGVTHLGMRIAPRDDTAMMNIYRGTSDYLANELPAFILGDFTEETDLDRFIKLRLDQFLNSTISDVYVRGF